MFWDLNEASKGMCETNDISVSVLTSVIGHNKNNKIIVDAGHWLYLKTLALINL